MFRQLSLSIASMTPKRDKEFFKVLLVLLCDVLVKFQVFVHSCLFDFCFVNYFGKSSKQLISIDGS